MAAVWLRWIKRYGPGEIGGILGVYLGFFVAEQFEHIAWVSAYAGAMGENLGFYGIILWHRLKAKENLFHIITEFGPAELLDSFLLRPAFLYLGVEALGAGMGLLAGKLMGDVVFYMPVILTHELTRFYQKKRIKQIN